MSGDKAREIERGRKELVNIFIDYKLKTFN